MLSRTRTDLLLLAGFCSFFFFYGISQFGLIGADEPRYAQVAREMLARKDWITPFLWGQPWLEKPPLYYWQAMLSYSVFGVSDWAARVPSAVDATLLILAVYLFFRRLRPPVALDAALVTAACAGIIGYSRAASTDMALASTFAIAMLAWWAWRETMQRMCLVVFYACMALGMLAKGPVAPLLAALVVALYSLAAREPRLILKTLSLPGILVFCIIALPWYFAVQTRNPQFFGEFILQHNLARFSSDLYHHREPFWYYLPVALLALLPWTAFIIAGSIETVRVWWSDRKSRPDQPDFDFQFSLFACSWLIVPVAFFTLSQSKLPGYILPAVPAGAILLANYMLSHSDREAPPPSKWLIVAHSVLAVAPFIPAVLIARLVSEHRLPGGKPAFVALAIAFLLAAGIALTLASKLGLRMLRFVTLIPVILTVAAVLKLGSSALDQSLTARPVAQDIASIETHPLPLAVYGVSRELEYGLTFYRNQLTLRYEWGSVPREEHLLVTPEGWQPEVAKLTPGRRVSFLGHYPPQHLDYFWVSAAPRE